MKNISSKTQKAIDIFAKHLNENAGKIYLKVSVDGEIDLIKQELVKINPEWEDRVVLF